MPANLTFTDIQTEVMNSLRLPITNTIEAAKIAALINRVYRDVAAKQDWWWLEKRTVINTEDKIDTGTISVTNTSTGFTFSSPPTINNVIGRVLTVPGASIDANAVYRVVTSAGGTYTIDAGYTNATDTAAGYRLYRDAFALPTDFGKLLYVKRYGWTIPVQLIGKNEMARLKTYDTSEGPPQVACMQDNVTTGDTTTARLLQIHPYPDKTYRLEVLYKMNLNTQLSGTTQPFVPDEYREILTYGALARGYAIFLNDQERSQFFQSLFNDLLSLMSAQNKEYSRDNPAMAPADDYRSLSRARRFRKGGYTLGNLFDVLPRQF
jgi:asparagine N-glycosylation enzyme membrane subunit Stt3